MSKIKEVGYALYITYQHIENKSNTMSDSKLSQNSPKVVENTVLLHFLSP